MAEEDDHLPPSMAPKGENDEDVRGDAAALFGIDLGDGPVAPIDLDDDSGGGRLGTPTPMALLHLLLGKVSLVSANHLCGTILRRSLRMSMVNMFVLRLPVRCVEVLCLLYLDLALVT
jgi:hypothetical protein